MAGECRIGQAVRNFVGGRRSSHQSNQSCQTTWPTPPCSNSVRRSVSNSRAYGASSFGSGCLPAAPTCSTSPAIQAASELRTYDPSPISNKNPLTQAQIADKLGVTKLSSNEDLQITKVDGKTVIKISSKEAGFDIGYTTHDNASSKMQLQGNANRTRGHDIPGRYKIEVENSADGTFSYTLTLDENLSGAALRIGNKDYVVSTSEELKTSAKPGTIGEFLAETPQEVRSPSDIIPEGLSIRQYLGAEDVPQSVLDMPFKEGH